jgi:ribosomal protein L37AE/L43A
VNAIWVLLSLGLNYLGFSSLLELLLTQTPVWINLLTILMLVPIVVMYMRAKYISHHAFSASIPSRPTQFATFIVNRFGVKWKALYGTYLLGRQDPYAFVEGNPLCPDCDYEMEAEQKGLLKRYYWKCDRCGKSYKCPVKQPYDASRIVERLLESEARSGRLNRHGNQESTS